MTCFFSAIFILFFRSADAERSPPARLPARRLVLLSPSRRAGGWRGRFFLPFALRLPRPLVWPVPIFSRAGGRAVKLRVSRFAKLSKIAHVLLAQSRRRPIKPTFRDFP